MSIQARLGELHLSYPLLESNIDLFLSVSFTGSANDLNGANLPNFTEKLDLPWLCRGRDYKLILQIFVDSRPANSDIAKHLQNIILNSEFWDQFCLRHSVRCNSDVEQSLNNISQAVVHLSYRHDLFSSLKSSKHKLLSNVSFTDVQPPEGFPIVHVESVVFMLNYCQNGSCLEKSSYSSLPLTGNGLEILADVCVSYEASISRLKTDDPLLNRIENISQQAYVKPPWQDNYETSLSLIDDIALYSSQESSQSNESEGSLTSFDEKITLLQMERLIDVGLRLSICDGPKKPSKEISILSESLPAGLSAVMPSLWCPGFLRAISERSVFLPTISHALSHTVYPNCTSQSLRAKLENICLHDRLRCKDESLGSDASSKIYSSLQRHLWAMLQKQLSDTNQVQSIKPIIKNNSELPTSKYKLFEEFGYYSETMFGVCSDSDYSYVNGEEDCYNEEYDCDFGSHDDEEEGLFDSDILFDHLEDEDADDAMLLENYSEIEKCDDNVECEYKSLLWSDRHMMDEYSIIRPPSPSNSMLEGVADVVSDDHDGNGGDQTKSIVCDGSSLAPFSPNNDVFSHDYEESMLL